MNFWNRFPMYFSFTLSTGGFAFFGFLWLGRGAFDGALTDSGLRRFFDYCGFTQILG
jgi:hypothetical protein